MPEYFPDQPIVRGRDVIYRPGGNADLPLCACGCDRYVRLNRAGRANRYLKGHSRRGATVSPEAREKLAARRRGQPGPWRDRPIPTEARLKMSAAKKGVPLTAAHRASIAKAQTGKPHPAIHHPQSVETRLKKSLAQRGPLGSNWQGGRSTENERARASAAFSEWRIAVFRRDGFCCIACGDRRNIHAHHIKAFAKHVELRFEVSNGQTLCHGHHFLVHHKGTALNG